MGIRVATNTVLGAATGASVAAIAAMLGLDYEATSQALHDLSEAFGGGEALPIHEAEKIQLALYKFEGLEPELFEQARQAGELPNFPENKIGLLTADERAIYADIQQNWEQIAEALPKVEDLYLNGAIGGGVGALAGGYAGYKLAGGGQGNWQDRVAAQRAAAASTQRS